MNCDEVKSLLDLFLDDELDSRNTLLVQRHIDGCPACGREVESLLVQDRMLRNAALAETVDSKALREKILEGINSGLPSAKRQAIRDYLVRFPRYLTLPRFVATAALIVVIGLIALLPGRLPGLDNQVYAAMAEDHAAHCSVADMMGATAVPDQLNRLSVKLIGTSPIPDLSQFGYRNPRGRICTVGNREFLHLVYYHQSNLPLSVFMRRSDGADESPAVGGHDGFSVVAVSKSGVEMFVITSLDRAQSLSIAAAAISRS